MFWLADTGWTIISKQGAPISPGQHDYDPAAPDKGAFFLASGPRVKNVRLGIFKNTEAHQLLCGLFGIRLESTNPDARLAKRVL